MEMMANGLLVVTTDGNGLTDMFRHGYNALVAPIKSNLPENLEQTLKDALGLDENVRASICHRAKTFLQTHCSLSSMREGYHKLINK
jgi:glycosyltransferase involved in cell wall biosynthesis